MAYRFIIATLLLLPYILLKKQEEIKILIRNKWVWVIGLSESLGLSFQYVAQSNGSAPGITTLLILCYVLMVPFLSRFILGSQIKKNYLFAIIIGLVGVYMTTVDNNESSNSESLSVFNLVLLLIAAFFYGLYLVATSKINSIDDLDVDTHSLFFLVLMIIAIISTLSTLIFDSFTPVTSTLLPWLILIVIFPTIIAFLSYFEALKDIDPNQASALLVLQVLVPFLIDYLIFDIVYGIFTMIGSLVIIISVAIVLKNS